MTIKFVALLSLFCVEPRGRGHCNGSGGERAGGMETIKRADSIASTRTDGSELDECDSVDGWGTVPGVFPHASRAGGSSADLLSVSAHASCVRTPRICGRSRDSPRGIYLWGGIRTTPGGRSARNSIE